MPLRTPVALVVALFLLGPATRSAASVPAPSLSALEREYAQHLLLVRPDRGSRQGVRGAAARLTPVTVHTLDQSFHWLDALLVRARALERGHLSLLERSRLDSLLVHAEAEQAESSPSAPLRREAQAYRRLCDLAVLEVLTAARVGECERVRRATRRLRVVPEVLRAAAINLRDEPQQEQQVREMVAAALRTLRVEVPAAAAACRDSRRTAEFVEADSAAIRAFENFPRWLSPPTERTP